MSRRAPLVLLVAAIAAAACEDDAPPIAAAGHASLGPGADDVAETPALHVDRADGDRGLPGYAVTFTGVGFGPQPGEVTWGASPCAITLWTPTEVTIALPDDAPLETRDLVVAARGQRSAPFAFTVVAADVVPTPAMTAAWTFLRERMRHPKGSLLADGVYTSLKDKDQTGEIIYLEGHHVTSEHMGLMMFVAAALSDHRTFEESYRFVAERMVSPRFGVLHWGIDKKTGEPFEEKGEGEDENLVNFNAPFDDLRVVNAAAAGYARWHDPRYLALALTVGRGLLVSTVTAAASVPRYPGGLVAAGLGFSERTGESDIETYLIPVNGGDLYAMRWLEAHDPKWTPVRDATVTLMRDAFVGGQFQGTYVPETNTMRGDWEYVGLPLPEGLRGGKIKTIQSLWTAIHLARAGVKEPAAQSLAYYKKIYGMRGRISEYMNPEGTEPTENYFQNTLVTGEARIYAQVARLAHYLGDTAFETVLVRDKILLDQDLTAGSPRYGYIGKSTADDGDADSFNTLEALLALALQKGAAVVNETLPVPP